MAAGPTFGDELDAQTETYLDQLTDCVALLPEILGEYAADGDYESTFEEIGEIESECDGLNREINGTITNAGPDDIGLLNSRVHFNASELISFYGTLDVIANHTERIAQELLMMRPPHDNACFEGLHEMAYEIEGGLDALETAVVEFVHAMSRTDESTDLTEDIEAVRAMESACDELRNSVISRAFDDDGIDQPLMYREFAILFDELANTMEDITDQVVIIASNEPGITTEPKPEQ